MFNSLLGWENSATYGSVISYNVYWLAVILGFSAMYYNEKKGHWPFMKPKYADSTSDDEMDEKYQAGGASKDVEGQAVVREVDSASSQEIGITSS